MASPQPKAILITGASSGLGAALAAHFAAPGKTLFLSGRHSERLAKVVADCQKFGATVYAGVLGIQVTRFWVVKIFSLKMVN